MKERVLVEVGTEGAELLRAGDAAVEGDGVAHAVFARGAAEGDDAGEGLRGDFVEAVGTEVEPAVGGDEAGDVGLADADGEDA